MNTLHTTYIITRILKVLQAAKSYNLREILVLDCVVQAIYIIFSFTDDIKPTMFTLQ